MFGTTQIAEICHEANRALCQRLGDRSQSMWDTAPQWQRDSAINRVEWCRNNPDAPHSANHDNWMKEKVEKGWSYGPEKDETAKTHPCLVPFENLPPEQQAKDRLFGAIVGALS